MTNEIEETIAHLQKTVDDLSDVVARQDKDISKLQHLVGVLIKHIAQNESEQGGGVIIGDDRPPHY